MSASAHPPRILLQTTIPYDADDWHVGRFDLLRAELAQVGDVVARDRENGSDGNDPALIGLAESDFDQLWLIAVDNGDGITPAECTAIARFRRRGGAIFSSRDHADLGSSICKLGGIGAAHYFHSTNPDPNIDNRVKDNPETPIDWPNFMSGDNGNVQTIEVLEPVHPVLRRSAGVITTLPSHPHEGDVGPPPDEPGARTVAIGHSRRSGRPFNIAVAFDAVDGNGRGWAESSFHHFCDYNWDVRAGCPSFVTEAPSDAILKNPKLVDDAKLYARNIAAWLSAI